MALPSQMERTTDTGRQGAKKPAGGGGGRLIGGLIVALAAGGLVWGAVHFMNKPKQGEAPKPGETGTQTPGTTPGTTPGENATAKPEPKATPGGTTGPLSDALKGQPTGTPTSLPDAPKPAPVDVTKNPSAQVPTTPTTPGAQPGEQAGAGTPTNVLPASDTSNAVRALIDAGDRAKAANKLVEARASYSKALLHPDAVKSDQAALRDKLTQINDDLLFSSKITPGDPMSEQYAVASGDALEKIARRRDLLTRWELIMRLNKISDPGSLKIGQKLKLVRGPFHAVVSKSEYRLDLFWGSPDDQENWLFVRSFKVGLGEGNGTPVGTFTIKNRMKNPSWKNPRTGEYFEANDPKNPIGEYWLGWQGQGASSVHVGFGLHGTVDPDSIGSQKSMGCVRMGDADIAMLWEFLSEQVSVVKVQN